MSALTEAARAARATELQVRASNRARAALAHEKTALAVLAAVRGGEGHRELARALGLSHVAIGDLVAEAEALTPVPVGRVGRGPKHIAQRYAAGEIDRTTVIQELSDWPYVQVGAVTVGLHDDGAPVSVPGSFDEVHDALTEGSLDADTYETILCRRAQQQP